MSARERDEWLAREAYAAKLRSLGFHARAKHDKVTHIDARDTGAESAVITEHADGSQSVEITPPTLNISMKE